VNDDLDVPCSAREGLLTVAVLVSVCVVLVAAADGRIAEVGGFVEEQALLDALFSS
jgi:hypothetical protein